MAWLFRMVYCAIAASWRLPSMMDANRPIDDQVSIRDFVNRIDQFDGGGQHLLWVVWEKHLAAFMQHQWSYGGDWVWSWANQQGLLVLESTGLGHHYLLLNQFKICSRTSGPPPHQVQVNILSRFQSQPLQVVERGWGIQLKIISIGNLVGDKFRIDSEVDTEGQWRRRTVVGVRATPKGPRALGAPKGPLKIFANVLM